MQKIKALFASSPASYIRDQSGSISILAAVLLPVLFGIVALVAEFGQGLLTKAEDQRVADLAAFAAAATYRATSSTTAMNAVIANVAKLNGLPLGTVTGSLVASSSGEANQGVSVTVSTTNLLLLAPVLGRGSSLLISASAVADFTPSASAACILALSQAGTGLTLGNSGRVVANACAVGSNTRIMATGCAQRITAKAVLYRTTVDQCSSSSNIVQTNGTSAPKLQKATADPLQGHPGIADAIARFQTMSQTFAALAVPPASNKNVTFGTGSTLSSIQNQLPTGCTAASASSKSWLVDCRAGATYDFGSVKVQNDHSAAFIANTGITFNVRGSIENGGKTLTFGAGTFNVGGNIVTSGTATSTFGSGTFNVGGSITTANSGQVTFGTGTFNLGGSITTANDTQATFGQGSFRVAGGIKAGSSSALSLGTGTGNSFQVGAASDGSALTVSNSAVVTLADATDSGKLFYLGGKVVTSNASCLVVGAAPQHDMKGALDIGGGLLLGTGTYTIDGHLVTSNAASPCGGSTIGIKGVNVTLVLSGSSTCSGSTVCIPEFVPGRASGTCLREPRETRRHRTYRLEPNRWRFTRQQRSRHRGGRLLLPERPDLGEQQRDPHRPNHGRVSSARGFGDRREQ